ncbi:MAG: prepilin-type N-terminal cleavage/methylation domain-containing protein [Desulfobacteraceae bacterium]|nr:prepilin-type N-terminal cleavage/methylation domain-containing protein [Desulfobacteraceae bacterium]
MKPGCRATDGAWMQCGFTLLEMLIAVAIFGVIATIVYSSFNALISRTDTIKSEAAVHEMAANCLNRISRDLQALYVEQPPLYKPPDYDDDPDPYRFAGEMDYTGSKRFSRLGFVSSEHLVITGQRHYDPEGKTPTRSGLARIRYHVDTYQDKESDSGYALKRGDKPFPYDELHGTTEPEKDPVLCTGITELSFVYLDSAGNEFETWNSEDEGRDYATPRAVQVALKINADGREHSFSTRIVLPVYREPIERVKRQ